VPANIKQKIRVFISYPGKDGLSIAQQAESILNKYGHKPWLYDQHCTLGAILFREIAFKIRRQCDAMLYLCTNSSLNSWGQQLEAAYALSNRKIRIVVITLENAQVPDELMAFNYIRVNTEEFNRKIEVISKDLPKILHRIQRLNEEIEATIE